MSSMFALGRLVWRPATLLSLLVLGFMGLAIGLLDAVLLSGSAWLRPLVADAPVASGSVAHVAALLSLGLPLALGVLVSDDLRALEHCPFAFTLPGLRAKWLRALPWLAAAVAAATAFAAAQVGGVAPAPAVFCLATGWFALGLLLLDPHARPTAARVATGLALAAFLGADWIALAARAQPALLSLAGLALAGAATAVRFGREGARARALVPTWQLPASVRSTRQANAVAPAAARRSDPDRLWPLERIGDGARRWARAAFYEGHGFRRGGWLRLSAAIAVAVALGIAALGYEPRLGGRHEPGGGLAGAWRALAGIDVDLVTISMLCGAFVGAQLARRGLTPGLLHPLARRTRADVVWLQALATNVLLAATLAAAIVPLEELLRRSAGLAAEHPPSLALLGVLLAGVIVTPLVQAGMQRAFTAGCGTRPPIVNLSLAGALGFTHLALTALVHAAGRAAWTRVGPAFTGVLALGLLAGGQLALRAWLRRHYARRDLL